MDSGVADGRKKMFDLAFISNLASIEIDKKATVGDILTSLTILISLVLFLISFYRDRKLRRKEQADKVRRAAANTIGKLDRWKEISLSIYQSMDIIFVEASEKLKREDHDTESVKDFLWKKLQTAKKETKEKILKEDIETAYVGLYSFDPSVRSFFEDVLTQLNKEEDSMFKGSRKNFQSDIMSFNYKDMDKYNTSNLRDQLFKHLNESQELYEKRIGDVLIPVSKVLLNIISESDDNLNKHITKRTKSYFKIKQRAATPP